MDEPLVALPWRPQARLALPLVFVALSGLAWLLAPRGARVSVGDIRIAEVVSGELEDDAVLHAFAEPLEPAGHGAAGRFKLVGEAEQYYQPKIRAGLHGIASDGARDWPVEVVRADPHAVNGHFRVELLFSAEPPKLRAGQGLIAGIALGTTHGAVLLPDGACLEQDGRASVFVAKGGGADRRNIVPGRRSNGQVEVLSGLVPGEYVIVFRHGYLGDARHLYLGD